MEGSPAVILILLLAWGVWYTRPVSVYGLIPGVKRADSISLYSRPLGPYRSDGPSSIRDLRPEDPKWDAALRALEAPAFAVPPGTCSSPYSSRSLTLWATPPQGDRERFGQSPLPPCWSSLNPLSLFHVKHL